ncbi:unnamed protein product [Ixodes pacificus]
MGLLFNRELHVVQEVIPHTNVTDFARNAHIIRHQRSVLKISCDTTTDTRSSGACNAG